MRLPVLRALLCLALVGASAARAEEAAPAVSGAAESSAVAETPAPEPEVSNTPSGELTSAGATMLQTRGTRIGVRAGPAKIGQVFYLAGSIEGDIAFKNFGLGLGTPVNIPVYDPSKGLKLFPDGVSLRSQDYATWQNFVRVIRYATYGKKEGDLYINLSQQTAATIGHGGAVRRFLPNLDINQAKLSAELDVKLKYGGFEAYVGDVLRAGNMFAGLAYLKPFGGSSNLLLERFSLGVTYAGDWKAPLTLKRAGEYPVVDGDKDLVVDQTRQVHIVGVSVETKVVKTESTDIKPFVYANQMFVGGGSNMEKLGGGLAVGGLGRFGFGEGGQHALRLVVEGRVFQDRYLPGYFNSFYDIQRYQYAAAGDITASSPTKLQDVMNRTNAMKLGYYAEAQYAWGRHFALAAAFEGSNATGGNNMMLHAEVPTFEWVRLFGTVYRRSIDFKNLLSAPDTIYFAGARVKLLPILFVNFRAFHSWQMDQSNTKNVYQNVNGFQVDAELGYEFSRK